MMRLLLIVFTVFCLQSDVLAIRAFFDYKVFYSPSEGTYVELITSFDGDTFVLTPSSDGSFQSAAELSYVLTQQGQVVDIRKLKVTGPLLNNQEAADFMSLERVKLSPGIYELEVIIRDLNDESGIGESFTQNIEIALPPSGPFISDVSFVSAYRPSQDDNAFSKSGYDVIPYISNYFPSGANALMFYAELYNTVASFGEDAVFVTNVAVYNAQGNVVEDLRRMKREKSKEVVVILQTLDITKLASGTYTLRLEIRNKENEVVASKERFFSRSKVSELPTDPLAVSEVVLNTSFAARYTNGDSLFDILSAHLPIAGTLERNIIDRQLKTADLKAKQSFFYSFWSKRNPANPEQAWRDYERQLADVQKAFGTRVKPGWKTDRGRVYLQYGPPNTRAMRHHLPDYFPFEIWHYYETNDKLHDRRFLFYDTSLGGDFELLHTDVPNETKNFQWKTLVRTRPLAMNAADASQVNANQMRDPYSGDELEDLWYNPY